MFRNIAFGTVGIFALGAMTAALASPPPPMTPPVVRTLPPKPVTGKRPSPPMVSPFCCPQVTGPLYDWRVAPARVYRRQGIMNPYNDISRLKAEIRAIEAEIGRLLNLSAWDYAFEPLSVEYWEGVLADKLALLAAWTR